MNALQDTYFKEEVKSLSFIMPVYILGPLFVLGLQLIFINIPALNFHRAEYMTQSYFPHLLC